MVRGFAFCWIFIISASCLFSETSSPTATAENEKVYVAVFDFASPGGESGNAQVLTDQTYGAQLADAVRLKLRREGFSQKNLVVIDRLTTREAAESIDALTSRNVRTLMAEKLGAHVGLFGTVFSKNERVFAKINCIDLRKRRASKSPMWSKVFVSRGERARAELARQIVEAFLGNTLQKPVEYGDAPEPAREKLGEPLNVNGTFDDGAKGWDAPDNVSTFLIPGPEGRGKILRVRTDLAREPWLEYRKALRAGKADPANPPAVATDTSYNSVAGLEGVHVRGEWIKATPGKRYWLLADCRISATEHKFKPKVFVKGFKTTPHAFDGLPESSLAEMNLSPEQFAALPEPKRKRLIEADAKKNPMRYVRECYRWYLPCNGKAGTWNHFAAPFPPRGGLPDDVEFLQIQVYSYWPPGEYLWDNVLLFEAPEKNK
jgi:hypothetical protein